LSEGGFFVISIEYFDVIFHLFPFLNFQVVQDTFIFQIQNELAEILGATCNHCTQLVREMRVVNADSNVLTRVLEFNAEMSPFVNNSAKGGTVFAKHLKVNI
jgi:hypothetical protein